MSRVDDRIKRRIEKVYRLAVEGVDGERDTARRMFEKLLVKYDLHESDFSSDHRELVWFKYKGRLQKKLLHQVIHSVCKNDTYWKRKRSRTMFGVDVTKSERFEIEFRFGLYSKALTKEIDRLYSAFLCKNDLLADYDDSQVHPPLSPEDLEELRKIAMMVNGIDRVPVMKAMEHQSG